MIYVNGATSQSFTIQIVDDSGLPVTGLTYATAFGGTMYYSRGAATADQSITLVTLASLTTAYATSGGVGGGFIERGNGFYRLDLPDACFVHNGQITVWGEASGQHCICPSILVTGADLGNQSNLGLSAIPNAVAGATGGLLIAGSNAATTFATLTVTGAFTVNGTANVSQTGDSYGIVKSGGAGDAAAIKTGVAAIPTNPLTTLGTNAPANWLNAGAFASAALTSAAFASPAFVAAHFASAALTSASFASPFLVAAHLASGTLTSSAFASAAITPASLASPLLTAAHFGSAALTSSALASPLLTSAHFASAALTSASFASPFLVAAHLASGTLTSSAFASAAITPASLASPLLKAAHFDSAAITSASLASPLLAAAHFGSAALTSSALASPLLTSAHFASAALTSAVLASPIFVAAHFASAALTSSALASPVLVAAHFASTSLQALAVGGMTAAGWAGALTVDTTKAWTDAVSGSAAKLIAGNGSALTTPQAATMADLADMIDSTPAFTAPALANAPGGTGGAGTVLVNQDTGGTDALRIMDGADHSLAIQGATLCAYLTSDYNAGTFTLAGESITDSQGRWSQPMYLLPGNYTGTASRTGFLTQVFTFVVS